jgi:TPR repeat protein
MSSETAQIVAMAKTLDLVTRGAKLGDVECMSALGVGHMEGIGLFYQDYNEAVKWLRPAAERGNAAAQNNLGICYLHGHGVTQDYGMAAGWIRKAAEQGDTRLLHTTWAGYATLGTGWRKARSRRSIGG